MAPGAPTPRRLTDRSHTGYEIGETDVHDVAALHRRFGLPVPDIYTDLTDT